MCTSFTINRNKTLVGWNLDILDMEYRVTSSDEGVFIEIYDSQMHPWMGLHREKEIYERESIC